MTFFSLVTLVNDSSKYAVSRCSIEESGTEPVNCIPIDADGNAWSASEGLNAGLDAALGSTWVICAHQDVWFPPGWLSKARSQLGELDERVLVAGLYGSDRRGRLVGHILDPHGHRRSGDLPATVSSLDELLIFVRQDGGLRFDPAMPGFHCYGVDIVRAANQIGGIAAVIDAPVIHLSPGRLDDSYHEVVDWIAEKWGPDQSGGVSSPAALVRTDQSFRGWIKWILARYRRRKSRVESRCQCSPFN